MSLQKIKKIHMQSHQWDPILSKSKNLQRLRCGLRVQGQAEPHSSEFLSSLAWCGGALLLIDPYYLRLLALQVVCDVILFLKMVYVKNTSEYAKSYVSKYVRKTVSWLHWSTSQLYPGSVSRSEGGMSNNKTIKV